MKEDVKLDAAIDLTIAVEKNAEFVALRIAAMSGACASIVYFLTGSLGDAAATFLLLAAILETRHEILQYLRRSERASIYREHPELFSKVQEEVAAMKSEKRFWRSLDR